ncbi:sidekick-2 [Pelobates cultripes]|uniref:Sidekick-2 n=1 Tax=Pelobates cultripes TaxID=61616 RepID=A0AAD1S5C0_PELCU|nr:sidekick-2 [Pelobates cultripes]
MERNDCVPRRTNRRTNRRLQRLSGHVCVSQADHVCVPRIELPGLRMPPLITTICREGAGDQKSAAIAIKSTQSVGTFHRAITKDNTLVILSSVAPDAGRYYVQAVNDKNGDNKTSQPITLTVENVGGPADPIAPTIIISPQNTSVVAGTSEVTMECVANARPLIKLNIVWKKDGALLTSGVSEYGRRLTLLSPTVSDAGYYSCEATLRSSSVPPVTAGAFLNVLGEH